MSNAFDKASLVMLPHAYEEGKVYSLKPTDRSGDFTFSRGTDTATRVGEDGYIKKEYANLLYPSNDFSTWTNVNSNDTSGQAGYDGSNDATLLQATAVSGVRLSKTISQNGVYTFSLYAKSGTQDFIGLYSTGSSTKRAVFDLNQGVSGSETDVIDSYIEAVGTDGWYRCSITFNASSNTELLIYIFSSLTSSSVTTGDNIYIQDAQLNPGLVAYPYLETTTAPVYGGLTDNMPRLDYTDATCPSLLLEPQRTNLVQSSEYFDSYLTKSGLSVSNNVAISPEGLMNASKLIEDSSNQYHYISQAFGANVGSCTTSVYAKSAERSHIMLWNSGANSGQIFNLDNGTKGSVLGNSPLDSSIELVGNGWYRCSIYNTNVVNAGVYIASSNTSSSYQGDGTSGVYIYGLQVEQGSYPTSYIPTYGSSQTRADDSGVASNLASLIDSTQGTIFFEGKSLSSVLPNYNYFISLSDSTLANRMEIRQTTDEVQFLWRVNNSYQSQITTTGITITDFWKVALKYSSTEIKMFFNGSLVGTISSPTLYSANTLNRVGFDDGVNNFKSNNKVKQALLFDTALSDSECIALTTV